MSEISVTVVGSTTINPTVGNGDTVNVTIASTGERGPSGSPGAAGPANSLSIGTVASGSTASATITGTAPAQVLSLVIPAGAKGDTGAAGSVGATGSAGPAGPANSLSIGTVTSGTAAATITGTAPNQTLNLVLQKGDTGSQGPAGPTGPAVNLTDETPQPLGTASAGTALSAARADHVHAVGSITYSSLSGIPSTFAPSAHTHAVSDVTGLQTALDGKQAAGTYATLVGGTVPSSQLPSYVDDVIEYSVFSAFPATNDGGKIFVARDTGKIYRWSGSAYVEISPSPGSTDSVTEGSVNLYHTTARAAAAAPVQSVNSKTGVISLTASDVGAAATSHTHSLANLTQSSATTGQVATWNGTAWAAATPAGGGGGSANIVEAATAAGFPATGATGTLYHATDVRRIYFWDATGSVYVEAGPSGGGGGGGGGGSGEDSLLRSLFVPTAPTGLTATAGNAQVALSWTAPTGVVPITGYRVEYTPSGGSPTTVFTGSTAATYTLTGLSNGTAYTVRVAAVNVIGTGALTAASAAVTPTAGTPPNAPTSLTATAGNAQIALAWTAPSAPGTSAITGYSVEYTPSGGSAQTVSTGSASTSYTLTSLANGTAYTVRVAAVSSAGTGAYTAASAAVTPSAGAPYRAIPTMTSNTAPSGVASASPQGAGFLGPAYAAFDNDNGTAAGMGFGDKPFLLQYDFGEGVQSRISGYSIVQPGANSDRWLQEWSFEGSDDGVNYVELDSRSGGSFTTDIQTYSLATSVAYRMFRLKITYLGFNSGTTYISSFQLLQ